MAMGEIQTPDANHPSIICKEGTRGGKPIITGTGMTVSHIVTEYERMGWAPDEIVNAHPHLTLGQVHAALAYYYDHAAEINREIRERKEHALEMEKKYGGSALEEKRRAASDIRG